MTNPADLVFRDDSPLRGAYYARFAEDAEDEETRIHVIIPAFDQSSPHGPCPWVPREGVLPQKGGSCLVLFDNDSEPWVIAWWPYD